MQSEAKKSLKSEKKINAADILDAGGEEKKVFFSGLTMSRLPCGPASTDSCAVASVTMATRNTAMAENDDIMMLVV